MSDLTFSPVDHAMLLRYEEVKRGMLREELDPLGDGDQWTAGGGREYSFGNLRCIHDPPKRHGKMILEDHEVFGRISEHLLCHYPGYKY